jgi:hypothetical protein
MWQAEPNSVRDEFKKLAENEKVRHRQMNPGYHYQPRRPGQKKRRMSKKRIAEAAINDPIPPTDNYELVTNPQNRNIETGRLSGDFSEIRTLTLPMSSQAEYRITMDNEATNPAGVINQMRIGVGFTPSEQYSDTHEADLEELGEYLNQDAFTLTGFDLDEEQALESFGRQWLGA